MTEPFTAYANSPADRGTITRRHFLQGLCLAAWPVCNWPVQAAETPGERLFRFAHVTDLHFTSQVQARYPGAFAHVRSLVDQLNAEALDFVLFTGDMVHIAADWEAELSPLHGALSQLRHPYYCAFGNPDIEGPHLKERKAWLMANLGDQGLQGGEAAYSVKLPGGVRLIVLDSTDAPANEYRGWRGCLGERQLRWLNQTLQDARHETVFLALHHPPVNPWPLMEALSMEPPSAQHLAHLVQVYPQIQLVLSGHYHMGLQRQMGGATVLYGPSLVEHPHAWRVLELRRISHRWGNLRHSWRFLPETQEHHPGCTSGHTGWRSWGLHHLSDQADGNCLIDLPS